MKTSSQKGFTLIELLVVIAIIGILSGIVLTSLNTARNKANDAAVKADLNGIRTQAEIVYDTDGDYDDVCGDAKVIQAYTAAGTAGGGTGVCQDSTTAWAASAPLKTSTTLHWCVDSTGTSTSRTGAISGTAC